MNIFEASIPLSAGIKVAECLDSAATFVAASSYASEEIVSTSC